MFIFVFVFFLFNNPVSSRICKLPIRCEIHNCTFKNTNKVSIIIIVIIINSLACSRLRDSGVREIEKVITPLYFRAHYTYSSSLLSDNLVPRVLSYPPYKRVGRVGENPGNEVDYLKAWNRLLIFLHGVFPKSTSASH